MRRSFLEAERSGAGRKLRRKDGRAAVAQGAVWALFIIETPPEARHGAGLQHRAEQVGIEAFVAKAPIERLDMPVLLGAARLDETGRDALAFAPGQEMPAGEFRAVAHAEGGFGVEHRPSGGPERAKRVRGHLRVMVRRRFS